MTQLSLFADSDGRARQPSYPHAPGFKQRGGASEAAARIIAPRISGLRAKVLQEITRHPEGVTADEVADAIGKTEFSVRPRVTELQAIGKIVPTGERRRNRSGMSASVWKVITGTTTLAQE